MEGRNKFNIFRYATISVVVFFIVLFFHADISLARENVYAPSVNITEDTIWTLDNSPYVISGWAWMDVNAVLTIESGVVIKFVPDNWNKRYNGIQISNGGKIIAQGTEENPIIFTSYYDDEYAGDTNADADASSPAAGDWRGIIFDADESELSYVKILYASNIYQSYGAIEVKNSSSAQFSNSTIQYCAGSCVRLNEPNTASFSDVIISNSADYGIYSYVAGGSVLFSDSTIQNCVDGIAKLSAGNTINFNNITLSGNKNVIELSGSSIANSAKWPKIGDSPYILRNDIEILVDAILTIEPGVVIKGENGDYPDSRFEIYGKLLAQGTEDKPIIFTSLSDNPSIDDWGGLYFNDSQDSVLEYVVLEYGGRYVDDFSGAMYTTEDYNMIHLVDSSVSIITSTIGLAKTAIYLEGESSLSMVDSTIATTTTGILSSSSLGSTISGSSFENNSQYAINNFGAQIIAQNNWWQDNSGPMHDDNVDGEGQAVVGNVLFDPWTGKAPDRIPVILVPGIMGTELWKGDDLIWPDIVEIGRDIGDDFMNVLMMDSDGFAIDGQVATGDIVRTAPTKDIFEGLINEFEDLGYEENTDLFVFAYDWRLDIRTSSQSLKQKIDLVLSQTSNEKVNIVAHSMGGLLSKQYILDNSFDSINKLIFVGTPHLGAPNSAKTLLFGDDLGIALVFSALSSDRIKYISQNMPAIYQLLPSQRYFSDIGSYYGELGYIGYNYDAMYQYFINQSLNPILLDAAEDFHSASLDNFDASGLDIYNINGCDTPTVSSIVKRNDGFDSETYSLTMSAGDGTVSFGSSSAINVDSDKEFYFKNGWWIFNNINHSDMPSTDGIRELITQIITEDSISLPDNATQDSSECVIEGKLVSVHSPVNLHIYDSEGNHVGRGENGDIEYNISGVAYEEIGENKFVFLPESSGVEYRVELDGTGEGAFSLRVSKIENNIVTETAYYNDIPVNKSSEATITLATSTSETILQVDEQGTGTFEQVVIAAVLDSAQSADIIKPSTTILISGNLNTSDRYISSASITLSSLDDNAGILKIDYSLDSSATWIEYSNSFIINTIGETTLMYRATDRAGNVESVSSQIINIDSPAPVILMPFMVSPDQAGIRQEDIEVEKDIKSKVLGVEVERPKSETYTKDEILNALAGADINALLDYLGKERDIAQEESVVQKYNFDFQATNFVCYGTKSTDVLGEGERAGVIYSFEQAFGRMPRSTEDWDDVIRISTNQVPIQRNTPAEERVLLIKPPLPYQGEGWGEGFEETDVIFIAYGLRPEKRDLGLEIEGIKKFIDIFGRLPSNTMDWNILRSLVY